MTEIGKTLEGTEKFLGVEQREITKENSPKTNKPIVRSEQILKNRTPTTIGKTIEGTEKFLGIEQKEIRKGDTTPTTVTKSVLNPSPKN